MQRMFSSTVKLNFWRIWRGQGPTVIYWNIKSLVQQEPKETERVGGQRRLNQIKRQKETEKIRVNQQIIVDFESMKKTDLADLSLLYALEGSTHWRRSFDNLQTVSLKNDSLLSK